MRSPWSIVSIISHDQRTFAQIGHISELKQPTVRLISYSGHEIDVLVKVTKEFKRFYHYSLLKESLFGHNWLMHFLLKWQSI